MSDFRHQIEEDIAEYQNLHKHIPNISKPEWAFNYWVLDKMFFEDEELIEEKIVDYHDLGIDAYEIYEDTKDIYLIQNKYYSDSSTISAEYVKNDFLIRAITALENGTYKKSDELQAAFNKYKKCDDFCVHLELFVTNNNTCVEANEYIKKFNLEHPKYHATIYYLNDIENKYYGEPEPVKKQITVKIETIVKGTALNINNESYKLQNIVDARYVKKSNMLKFGSQQYNTAINFIKSNDITNDGLIDLYLLYVRSEMERKRKSDSRFPISYYLIDEFAIHECNNRQKSEIALALSSSDKIDRIIKLYTAVTRFYTTQYYKDNNIDYNKMIKRIINYDLLNSARDSFQSSFDD